MKPLDHSKTFAGIVDSLKREIDLSLLATGPGFDLFRLDPVQHDLYSVLLRILLISLTPVIAYSICEDGTLSIEVCGCDGSTDGGVSFESMFGIAIPKVKGTIAPRSRESTVDRVERNGIDAEDIGYITVRTRSRGAISMAFEAEIVGRILLLDILNGASALDTAYSEASSVGEGGDDTSLVFERGLDGFVWGFGFVEVDDVDIAVGSAIHQ